MLILDAKRIYHSILEVVGVLFLNLLMFLGFFYVTRLLSIHNSICVVLAGFFVFSFNLILWRIGFYTQTQSNIAEKIFEQFTDNIDEVFLSCSPDMSKAIYVSASYDSIWGRSREKLFQNTDEFFESIVVADREKVKKILLSMSMEKIFNVAFEFSIRNSTGDLRQIYMRAFKYNNAKGEYVNLLGILTDITIYKEEQQAVNILRDIQYILDRESNLSVIVSKVLKIICRAFAWDFGEVWLVDKEKNVLRSVSIWDVSEWDTPTDFDLKSQRITFRPGISLPGDVWKRRELVWIEDLDQMELVRMREAAKIGYHSAVGMPIVVKDTVVGVLDFFSHNIKKPGKSTLNTLNKICEQIGLHIEKQYTEDKLIYASRHDAQSGLLNQSAFKDSISKLLTIETNNVALILLEMNRYELINDVIGLESGDLLVKMLVDRLYKISPQLKYELCRYETNLFLIYLNFNFFADVMGFADTIIRIFNQPFFINQEYIYLNVNIGITTNSVSGNDINSLLKHASLALEKSNKEGINNYNFFSSEISSEVHRELILETALRHALNYNELCLYFQPKVNLMTGMIVGVEALVRWQHPVKGLLLPENFIHLAEEMGLIIQLDEWALREVFRIIKNDWPMNPNGKGLIALNISPLHFNPRNDICSYIKSLMQEFNVNPKLIEFEITENVFLDEVQYNIKILNKLINMGFNLSLDDFGTGFNSLKYLLRVPVNKVKIDKSFIDGLPHNKNSIAIVRAVITMCHSLDKIVIAEGVETIEQAEFLKREGCDEIQGYYFSRPVPIDQFKSLISQNQMLVL